MQLCAKILLVPENTVSVFFYGEDGALAKKVDMQVFQYLYEHCRATADNTTLAAMKRIVQKPHIFIKHHILDRKLSAFIEMISTFLSYVRAVKEKTLDDDEEVRYRS